MAELKNVITIELIPCVKVKIRGNYDRGALTAWMVEEDIWHIEQGGHSSCEGFYVDYFTAEDAEKIRRWLADKGGLGEEHYCQRCGSSLDFPLRREDFRICDTCNGELDRGMWSSADLEKYEPEVEA